MNESYLHMYVRIYVNTVPFYIDVEQALYIFCVECTCVHVCVQGTILERP